MAIKKAAPLKSSGLNSSKDRRGRFAKGHTKLGGNVKGSKHRKTLFLEAIGEDIADEILATFINLCRNDRMTVKGDVECLLFAMKRLYPETNGKYIKIDLKKHDLHTIGGLNNAAKDVIDEVGNSKLTLEEGEKLVSILKDKRDFNLYEIEEEVNIFRKNKEQMGVKSSRQ